ncbi:hypothetical protein [Streptomyces sp. NPDC005435]|uniref:hypothetical protein n=1 Tax=Streptomyces sp. NPDC005435 TaxID=3154464 RepID=UPI0034522E77
MSDRKTPPETDPQVLSDSHAAVNALESVAFELGRMDDSGRAEFTEAIGRGADSADSAQREWIRDLPRNLGICKAVGRDEELPTPFRVTHSPSR